MSGKDPKPLVSDANVEVTRVKAGRDVWEYLGRPADVNAPPPGAPDGFRVEPAFIPREVEERKEKRGRQRADWDVIDEQQKARKLAADIEKTESRMRALVKKEHEVEARRKRRSR